MRALRRTASKVLAGISVALFAAVGIAACVLVLPPAYRWLAEYTGYLALPLILVLAAPIAAFGPFVFAIKSANWTPLLVTYGGGLLAVVLYAVAGALNEDSAP